MRKKLIYFFLAFIIIVISLYYLFSTKKNIIEGCRSRGKSISASEEYKCCSGDSGPGFNGKNRCT